MDTEERREITVLEADPGCGLDAEEVRLRVENGYVNRSDSSPTKSVGDIIKSNTFTFSTWYLLCWGLPDCSGVLYQPAFSCDCRCKYVYRDFSGGPFQKGCGQAHASGGAENTLYPGREWEEIPSSELVRDDIVEFDNGSQICADAVICSGQVTVNESLLTGKPTLF